MKKIIVYTIISFTLFIAFLLLINRSDFSKKQEKKDTTVFEQKEDIKSPSYGYPKDDSSGTLSIHSFSVSDDFVSPNQKVMLAVNAVATHNRPLNYTWRTEPEKIVKIQVFDTLLEVNPLFLQVSKLNEKREIIEVKNQQVFFAEAPGIYSVFVEVSDGEKVVTTNRRDIFVSN